MTMVGSQADLANRLVALGVERVVMGATSDYWKPIFLAVGGPQHGLVAGQRRRCQASAGPTEYRPVGCGLVVRKLAERQMLRPRFVPRARSGSSGT